MNVTFNTEKTQKIFNSATKLRGKYGHEMALKIQLRLTQLQAAENLLILKDAPGTGKCHALTGDRAGQFAVSLVQPYRLIFKPDHHPLPTRADGSLDWSLVTQVVVIEVVDYH